VLLADPSNETLAKLREDIVQALGRETRDGLRFLCDGR
jgi:hypothetical protein